MEPHEYVAILKKRWLLIVALMLVGAAAGLAYASALPKLYRATSTVFVASQRGDTTSELVQGSNFTQAQVQSFAQLATLPVVLDPVIDRLNLNTTAGKLAGSVTVDIRLNTVIIDVTVSDRSARTAAATANAVTSQLAEVTRSLYAKSAIGMERVASADVPSSTYSPNIPFNVVSGLLGGLVLAVIYSIARDLLDTRMRSRKDVERVTDAPFLGTIGRWGRTNVPSIVMISSPHSPEAEDIRRVATNIDFANVDNPVRSLVVTSGLPGEGKSSIAINLALAMSERHERVLLVDADLRKPSIAEYCGVEGSVGLTSVLVGSATLTEAISPWAGGVIDVLPSGLIPANPTQMLGSDAMAALFEFFYTQYDFIVIDSPPLLPVSDSLVLSKLTAGAVVIARHKSTRRAAFAETLHSLEGVSGWVLGVVLNGIKPQKAEPYYSYREEPPATGEANGLLLSNSFDQLFVVSPESADPVVVGEADTDQREIITVEPDTSEVSTRGASGKR